MSHPQGNDLEISLLTTTKCSGGPLASILLLESSAGVPENGISLSSPFHIRGFRVFVALLVKGLETSRQLNSEFVGELSNVVPKL